MAGDSKLIIKNGVLFSIAPYLPQALNIFLLPIMTKYLTSVDFGISGTISAYTAATSAFLLLGLNVVITNAFFQYPTRYKWIWRQLYGFLKLWMIVYAIIQATILFFFIPSEAQENKWLIIILANFSTVLFGPTGNFGHSYYAFNKQSIPIVWRSVAASTITVLVDFVLIVYFKLGYLGWYVGTFAGQFFTNASYWYLVNVKLGIKPIYNFKWRTIKHALHVGMPTIPHYYSSFLLESAGRIVMDRNGIAQGEIGKITISQTLGSVLNNGMVGLNQALSPFIMESIKNKNEIRFQRLSYGFITVVFSVAFLLAIWSKELFNLLLSNDSLKTAYPFFILYVMALCYRPLYMISSYYYFYYEKTKQLLLITFVSGCIAFVLYLILTPFLGIWGFSIGYYIACLYFGYSGFLYSTYRKYSQIKIPYIWLFIIQLTLTGVAFFIVESILLKVLVSVVLLSTIAVIVYKYKDILKK